MQELYNANDGITYLCPFKECLGVAILQHCSNAQCDIGVCPKCKAIGTHEALAKPPKDSVSVRDNPLVQAVWMEAAWSLTEDE